MIFEEFQKHAVAFARTNTAIANALLKLRPVKFRLPAEFENPRNALAKAVMLLSPESNEGLRALSELIRFSYDHDLPSGDQMSLLRTLDHLQIYDQDLHEFLHRVCYDNPLYMLAALRAYQYGLITDSKAFRRAIDGKLSFDAESCLSVLKEKFPSFGVRKITV